MDMNKMMDWAKSLEDEFSRKKEAFIEKIFEFEFAGGAIKLTMSGAQKLLSFNINKELIDLNDISFLEDTILVSLNEAIGTIKRQEEKIMDDLNYKGLF